MLYRLLDNTTAAFVAQSNYLIPAASIIFGAILFGERLAALQFVGFALILFGVAVSEGVIRRRRKKSGSIHRRLLVNLGQLGLGHTFNHLGDIANHLFDQAFVISLTHNADQRFRTRWPDHEATRSA